MAQDGCGKLLDRTRAARRGVRDNEESSEEAPWDSCWSCGHSCGHGNPRYHALISAFKAKTGCPVLVNTSFNVRGEPIACTPEDAFRCLMGAAIEVLVAGNCFLLKEQQDPALKLDYRNVFDPD